MAEGVQPQAGPGIGPQRQRRQAARTVQSADGDVGERTDGEDFSHRMDDAVRSLRRQPRRSGQIDHVVVGDHQPRGVDHETGRQ